MKRILGYSVLSVLFLLPLMIWNKGQLAVFSLTFVSIILEAFPFMLIGSLLSGAVEAFVPQRIMVRYLSGHNKYLMIPFAGVLGVILPSCECAIIPLVRRLMKKGMPFSIGLAYLLAGPIVNPVVALSTYYAYGFSFKVTAVRVFAGYCIAVFVAFIMNRIFSDDKGIVDDLKSEKRFVLIKEPISLLEMRGIKSKPKFSQMFLSFFQHARSEFFDVAIYLIVGAFVAAFLQHFVGRQALSDFGSSEALSVVVMMLFAIVSNLCSQTDAFIAATFQGTGISLSAQLAFLLLGPMLDVKLFFMYFKILKKRAVFTLCALLVSFVFFISYLMLRWFL